MYMGSINEYILFMEGILILFFTVGALSLLQNIQVNQRFWIIKKSHIAVD